MSLLVAALALVVLYLVVGRVADYVWFSSVGFGSVWTAQFVVSAGLLVVGLIVSGLFLVGNLIVVWPLLRGPGGEPTPLTASTRLNIDGKPSRPGGLRRTVAAVLFVVGLPVAGILVIAWRSIRFLAGPRLLGAAARALADSSAELAEWDATADVRPGPRGLSSAEWDATADVRPGLRGLSRRQIGSTLVAVGLLLALPVGLQLLGSWQTVALWLHRVPYAQSGASPADPIFGLDLGWWLFSLPFLHLLTSAVVLLLGLAVFLTSAAYGVASTRGADVTGRRAVVHLAVLGALLLFAIASGQWLGRYDVAYAQNGLVTGVTATDAAVRLPLGAVMAATSALLAIALLVLGLVRRERATRRVVLAGGSWYIALVVAGVVLPVAYQQLVVTPSQNVAEAAYVANNIALTRQGFALDGWQLQSYTGKASLSLADVTNDQATFNNARLWDTAPVAATLDQLQTVRQYYAFTAVDIDRYLINGEPTEVMLSAREMALSKSQSRPSWVAQHVLYTHGYGAAMLPVNGVDTNGLPHLIVKDLPMISEPGAPIVAQPDIYFGRGPSDWVLVNAKSNEFDYPSNSGTGNDVTTRYAGAAGISIGSYANRLFWAVRLGDLNLLTSDQVTDQTKLLIHRSLSDRLGLLAPFLVLDPNPYVVVAPSGHLVYVQDAYTTTGALPDATSVNDTTLGSTYDYIRNSVKITVDAFDGTTHFYVADPADPLIRDWEETFPSMFEPLSAMPAGLVAHLRTPAAMFNTQVQAFARYHVTDVASFYKSDDLWTASTVTSTRGSSSTPQAYYVEVRLPDQTEPEFVLVQPMLPASRPNMIAWVAARNDGTSRGQVIVYELPASASIQGPTQIEARIDQDPVISSQLSLWNQGGSKVIRGSLLTIPVGTSFLYLEPIYIQSTKSAFPQLTKVVVASSATVAWGNTLGEALTAVTSGAGTGGAATTGGASASPTPSGGSAGAGQLPTDVTGLIRYANQRFTAAKAAEAAGDFVAYGQEMQQLQAALDALNSLNSSGLSPSPSTGP